MRAARLTTRLGDFRFGRARRGGGGGGGGPADQSLMPSSIASGEAFGSPRLDLHLAPSSIASAEAFESPALVEPSYLFRYSSGTFTRSSEASWFDPATGSMSWWASGLLRRTAILTPSGTPYFALEESRTNRALQSENLGVAPWTLAGATLVAADSGAAPDGETDAEQITINAGGYVEQLFQTIPADNTIVSVSVFVKLVSGSGTMRVGMRTKAGAGAAGTTITPNGTWQRMTWTGNIGAGATVPYVRLSAVTGPVTVLLWGAQIEDGAFPTSYIRTTTAAATRAADHLAIPAASIPAAFLTGRFDVYTRPSFSDVDVGTYALGNLALFWATTGNQGVLAYRQVGGSAGISMFVPNSWTNYLATWARRDEMAIRVQHDLLSYEVRQNGTLLGSGATSANWSTGTAGWTVGRTGASASAYYSGLISEPTAVA